MCDADRAKGQNFRDFRDLFSCTFLTKDFPEIGCFLSFCPSTRFASRQPGNLMVISGIFFLVQFLRRTSRKQGLSCRVAGILFRQRANTWRSHHGTPSGYESRQGAGWVDARKGGWLIRAWSQGRLHEVGIGCRTNSKSWTKWTKLSRFPGSFFLYISYDMTFG